MAPRSSKMGSWFRPTTTPTSQITTPPWLRRSSLSVSSPKGGQTIARRLHASLSQPYEVRPSQEQGVYDTPCDNTRESRVEARPCSYHHRGDPPYSRSLGASDLLVSSTRFVHHEWCTVG